MKYIAKAKIKKKISLVVKIVTGGGGECPLYDLIDAGKPNTIYAPINGFNLIDGNP